MSDMQKRLAALKAKAQAGTPSGDVLLPPKAVEEPVKGTEQKPEIKDEQKPKEQKIECEFCGGEFTDIKKHAKSCKDNPENAHPSFKVDDIDKMVAEKISALTAAYEEKISNLRADINRTTDGLVALQNYVTPKLEKASVNQGEFDDLSSQWAELLPPLQKRWKHCPGYLKLINIFDKKIKEIARERRC